MLMIYHSNRLDVLASLMEFIIEREPLDNPFTPEIVLVQSTGISQWLQISLAQKFGIAANIKFTLPASFIWNMFMHVLPGIPHQSAFSKHSIRWKLMTLLPKMLQYKEFFILKQYLTDDSNKHKIFQLALHIADIYDQYLVYRPVWLTTWESGSLIKGLPESQIWQANLWMALVNLTKTLGQPRWHCANLYYYFINILNSTKWLPPETLPSRIFIYGISALPPIYIDVLKALGKYMDIHIMFTNPCRYYWSDIQDVRELAQLVTRHRSRLFKGEASVPIFKDCRNFTQIFNLKGIQALPNPLLASWGKLGRDYINILSDISLYGKGDIDAFSEITPDSLLHNVQLDILNLENRTVTGVTAAEFSRSDMKRKLHPNDRSLTVHVCHSPQREVEVLHDRLLNILQDDPSLSLRDIVVMAADIDKYSPFIQAVFNSATGNRYLPYAISDRQVRKSHPVIQVFIKLLFLPESRFLSEDVLALLDVPALASRFNINEEDLSYLHQWVNESGIRWGLDDDNVKDFNLPITGQHTWKFGLTRMLLGYAMESSEGIWKGILPYDKSSGLIAELVGHLASLLMQLKRWHHELKQPKPLKMWLPICQEMLNDFFLTNIKTETAIRLIEQNWRDIINEGLSSYYIEDIPLSLLRNELIRRLDKERISQRFLAGPVNICTLMPMRSIPFRVICLIGMNDSVYPKTITPLGFNLMRYQPKCGDRSRRDDDRYMFLEALISAKQILYISYIGYSIKDNSELSPSVMIQELMDYIGQSHYLPGDEACNCDESEHRVKQHITLHHSCMPFDPVNYEYNEQQSYAIEWLPAAKKEGTTQKEFIQQLKAKPIEILTFERLKSFWFHPVRAFFQQRLQINFHNEEHEMPYTEPFTLEGLNRYLMNQQLLNTIIEQKDIQKLFLYYRAAGQLPYGNFGKIIWEVQCQMMRLLAERVIKYHQPSQNMEIDLNCNGIQLVGWLQHVQSNGLLRWQPSMLNISQGLQLWLEHLVYIASGNQGESRLLVHKDKEWHFPSMTTGTAQYYLNLFIEGYMQGMNKPLLLLPESGWAWIQAYYYKKNDNILINRDSLQKARSIFLKTYKDNVLLRGKREATWYRRLWRTFEPKYINDFIKEAQCYLLPLFKFNQS